MRQTPRVAVARRQGGATALLIPIVATTVVAMSGRNAVAEDGCPRSTYWPSRNRAILGQRLHHRRHRNAEPGHVAAAGDGGVEVQREYVPYGAGFGGAVPGSGDPFTVSVNDAVDRAKQMAEAKLAQCENHPPRWRRILPRRLRMAAAAEHDRRRQVVDHVGSCCSSCTFR